MKFHTVMAAALAAMVATAAQADPRLDEKVYDPYVRNHVLEVETRVARETGGALDRSASYGAWGSWRSITLDRSPASASMSASMAKS